MNQIYDNNNFGSQKNELTINKHLIFYIILYFEFFD